MCTLISDNKFKRKPQQDTYVSRLKSLRSFFPSVAQRKALDLIFVHLHSMITLFKRNTKHDYYYHCNECTIWILENTSSHHCMHNFHFFLFNLFFVLNLFYFSLHSFKSAGKLNWTENELFFFLLVIHVVWGNLEGVSHFIIALCLTSLVHGFVIWWTHGSFHKHSIIHINSTFFVQNAIISYLATTLYT